MRRRIGPAIGGLLMAALTAGCERHELPARYKKVPIQYVAALAEPSAKSGTGAETWGLWKLDPGPRGVKLARFEDLKAAGGVAPAKWKLDDADWWLEEHGLIMEQPEFPMAPGHYVVTGDREVTTVLTIHPKDASGTQRWELADGATIHDVTHLGCRAARYVPAKGDGASGTCSPEAAPQTVFPVVPGAAMPPIEGCRKQDYAVLFLIAVADGE